MNHWQDMTDLIKSTVSGDNNSLFIIGDGGMGKTEVTLKTLDESNHPYAHFRTFSTPLELYSYLYLNKDKLVVMDDMEGILDNKKSISILKSCLWGYKGKREVQYLSSTDKLFVPPHFEFTGKTIILLNEFPKNNHVKSLITRSVFYEIKFSFEQKIKMMEEISEQEYPGISLDERKEVFRYIKSLASPTTKELNFRTLIKAFNIFKYSKDRWKPLVMLMLQPDEDLAALRTIEETFKDVKVDAIAKLFTMETGKSRSTFFRLKKRLKDNG